MRSARFICRGSLTIRNVRNPFVSAICLAYIRFSYVMREYGSKTMAFTGIPLSRA